MAKVLVILVVVLSLCYATCAKQFDECELATQLVQSQQIDYDTAFVLTCLANVTSGLNTDLVTNSSVAQNFGLFQVLDEVSCG